MKEVLHVYGIELFREDGSSHYARYTTALAVWFEKEPAIQFADTLLPHVHRAKVVKLRVTVEPLPKRERAKK